MHIVSLTSRFTMITDSLRLSTHLCRLVTGREADSLNIPN